MNNLTGWLANYLLNALWQVPVIFLLATGIVRLTRRAGPQFIHRVWIAALLLETALPAIPSFPLLRGVVRILAQSLWAALNHGTNPARGSISTTFGSGTVGSLHLASGPWITASLAVAGFTVAYFTGQMLWHLGRLHTLHRRALGNHLPAHLQNRWKQQLRQAGLAHVRIAVSAEVRGPAAIGLRYPIILLPANFAASSSPEDQTAALAHECAHVLRHDFAKNLAYVLWTLPLAWHPLRHFTLARVAESREMVCDAHAAFTAGGTDRYARSLLRLAAAFLSAPPASAPHAIGLCDAHTFERRIMSLTAKQSRFNPPQRLALGVLAAVLGLATCASATALRMNVTVPSAQAVPEADAVTIPAGVMAGQTLSRVNPVYPPEAKQAHIQGSVILHAVIGPDGAVQQLKVVSGPAELQTSALNAVQQWTFQPYLLNGTPTAVQTTITVNFQLAN